MAVLPQPYTMRNTPQAVRPIAQIDPRAAGAVGGAIAGFGQEVEKVGFKIQDEVDTASAKERDAYVADEIRKLLYDPQTGFANLEGKAAVEARGTVQERLNAIRESASKDLSKGALKKLDARLQSRMESALNTVDTHTSGARRTWLDGASNARIAAAEQDALTRDGNISAEFGIIAEELTQKAVREGWDSAVLDLELSKAKSTLMVNQAVKMAQTNPELALEYVTKNANDITPKDLLNIKSKLEPLADEYAGRRLAQRVYSGNTGYSTKIELAMGPARPYAPNQPVLDVIGSAAEDVFGPGARVVVTSGQEGDKHQHGSNRHKTGSAADIAIYRPDGTRVNATDADMAAFAKAAASRGALGIGFGSEYMGGEHIHVDMVAPGAGQGHAWASGADAIEADLVATMNAPKVAKGSINDILAEPNPRRRDAALQEYALLGKISANEKKARQDAAENVAFQHVEAGNDPAGLPLDVRQALGLETMGKLRTYWSKTEAEKATDPATYLELKQLQANDPQAFLQISLLSYIDRLSPTDYKAFVNDQTKPMDEQTRVASSTLMTVAKNQMEAAGIDTTPKPGSDEAKQNAAMQARLLRWQETFIRDNKRAPTQAEVDERVGQELVPVIMDTPWSVFDSKGYVFDVPEVEPEKLAETGITIGKTEVPPAVVQEQINAMRAANEPVTSEALVRRLAALMEGL